MSEQSPLAPLPPSTPLVPGMPDVWEHEHELIPNEPNDGNAIHGDGGHTNLEKYLNNL
jgi:hypothetical protein